MEQFIGECVTHGMAFAAVSRVLEGFGIASLPSARMARVADSLERDPLVPVEVEDLILVAKRPPLSLLHNNVPGYKIVGLALSEYPEDAFDPGIPCVCGLGESFLARVIEGDLALIDGNADTVTIDPEASLVAQYQAPARRRRFFLGDAHLPAKTASDNRVISVFAELRHEKDLNEALSEGADGLCLRSLAPHVVANALETSVAGQRRGLAELIDRTAGLPLMIDLPFEELSVTVFLEASRETALEIVVGDPSELDVVRQEIDFVLAAEPAGISGHLSLSVAIEPETNIPDLEAMQPAGGFVLRDGVGAFPGATLLPLLGYAAHSRKTRSVYLSQGDWCQDLEDAVQLGISRVICTPELILDVKDAIRTL